MTCLCTSLINNEKRVENVERLSQVSCTHEEDRFSDCIGDFYPNISEFALFDWHVIHVFKDMITERCRVNICSYTPDILFTHVLREIKV